MQQIFKAAHFAIAFNDNGKGLPVVMLHGFGEDSSIFTNQINVLEDHFRIITPDIPGTGNSTIDYTQCPATTEFLAETIVGLLDHLKIDKCVLLGHSMGGYITLAFAEIYPDRLLGFGLIHSTAFADTDEKKTNRLKGIDIMNQYGAAAFLRTTFPNLFSAAYKKDQPEALTEWIKRFAYISTDACTYYYQIMIHRTDKTSVLKNSTVPVLFVIGKEDIAAPMNDVLQQVPLAHTSFVHIFENVGHMSMIELPNKLNEVLDAYLKDME